MIRRKSSTKTFKDILESYGEAAANAGKKELKVGAEKIVADAKNFCPAKTGKLRDSIHAKSNKDGSSYKIVADAQDENGFYYGRIVEFSPLIDKPFLYPAYDMNKQEIKENILNAIRNAIRSKT